MNIGLAQAQTFSCINMTITCPKALLLDTARRYYYYYMPPPHGSQGLPFRPPVGCWQARTEKNENY